MKKTRLGKRVAAWLLCLAMVMTAINLPAFTTEAKAEELTYVTVTSWAELQAGIEAEGTDARYFKLGNDITASETDTCIIVGREIKPEEDWPEYFADLKKITIDLNGHTLDRGLADSEPEEGGSHFFIWENGSLSLVDNSGTKAGKITGANNTWDFSNTMLAGAITNGGTLLLRDITITGNKTTGYGGGIFSIGVGRVKNILSGKVIITGNLASEANGRSYIASDIHFQDNRTEVMNFDNMTTTGADKSHIGIRLYNPQPGDAFLLCEYNDSLAQVGDCIEIENAIEDAELSVKILDGAKKYLAIASCVHEYEYYDTSYDKCKLCGYMVTHLNIAAGTNKCRYCGVCVNYRYYGDHNWVNDASWHDDAENNSHYRFCNDCKENIYEDHKFASQDDNYHKCSVCGNVQEHAFKIIDEASGSKQCEVCGYTYITFDDSHKSVAIAGITYTKVEDGVTVKASDNSLTGDLVIPYEIATASGVLKIIGVEENGFSSCTGLTTVGIPNGVAYSKTDFPEGVAITVYECDTSNFSFEFDNGKLGVKAANKDIAGEIDIPSYVLYEGKVMPVEYVAAQGFYNCEKVTKIVLPDTVTTIEILAFDGCAELSSIYFSKSVEQTAYRSFGDCNSLTNIIVDPDNSIFQMQGEYLIDKSSNTLITATNNAFTDGKLVIPNGIEVIYGAAFFGRKGFTEVEIPTTVRIIGDSAFAHTDLIRVDIPFGVEEIGIYAFGRCNNLVGASLPSSLKRVSYRIWSGERGSIFFDCPNFTEKLNVPCSVNSIYEFGSSGFIGRFNQIVVVPDSYADNYYKQRGWTGYARTGTHDYTDQPWLVDAEGKHYQVCRGCGVESEHSDHTFVNDAENNNHKCSVCGTAQSHAFSENAKDVKIDGNKHGKECTICHGVVVTGNHDFSKYVSNGDGTHKVVCKDCNTLLTGHASDACSGGTATCKAKAKCSKCGEEYGSLAAHKGGTATCKEKAKCVVCGKEYGSLAAHTYATKWSADATNHWHACTVCGAKKDNGAHVDSDKNEKCDICSSDMHFYVDPTTRIVIEAGVKNIPTSLVEKGLDTEEKISEKMFRMVAQKTEGYTSGKTKILDVVFQVSLDGGNTWVKVTPDNFPSEGLVVTIPYPEGTNADDYDFVVTHMVTVSLNGLNPGDVEMPAVTKTAKGIQFTVKSLSPIGVSWKALEGSTDPKDPTNPSNPMDPSNEDVETGEVDNRVWLIALLVSLGTFTSLVLSKRKRKEA